MTERVARVMTGGKRKSEEGEEEGRKRKVIRYSAGAGLGDEQEKQVTQSTTPPGSPKVPVQPTTPIRSLSSAIIPTPAREILKAGYKADLKDEDVEAHQTFIVKPPTPPRMKPRPIAPSIPAAPTTPGKRCLSPDHSDLRSVKRIPTQDDIPILPTTPVRATSQEDVPMLSVSKKLSTPVPIRTTIASPHRALSSISRLNTPGKLAPIVPKQTPRMSSKTPTVPIPFSFTTPRSKVTAPHDSIPRVPTDTSALADTTAQGGSAESIAKEVKPLPKRASMAPPSKIPVRATKSSLPPLTASAVAGAGASKPKPSLGIAERRPARRTTSGTGPAKTLAVFDENAAADAPPVVRRKPSYPSSLGSGPLAQPRARLVSGPIQVPRSFTTPLGASTSRMDIDGKEEDRPTMRSVSDPVPRPRSSLASSTSSRREGFSADTSRSLAGLSDALAKLKVRREITHANTAVNARPVPSAVLKPKAPSVLADVADHHSTNTLNTSISSSSRLSNVHRPRSSIVGADVSMMEDGDRSIAALLSSSTGGKALKGVVAFVDVKTDDGACAGDLWSEMLRSLGAKVSICSPTRCIEANLQVNVRLTSAVTHIIYKSGLPTTLAWYRRQDQEERPYIVGVGWLLKSKKAGEKLDEAEFTVDIAIEDIFQKVSVGCGVCARRS